MLHTPNASRPHNLGSYEFRRLSSSLESLCAVTTPLASLEWKNAPLASSVLGITCAAFHLQYNHHDCWRPLGLTGAGEHQCRDDGFPIDVNKGRCSSDNLLMLT